MPSPEETSIPVEYLMTARHTLTERSVLSWTTVLHDGDEASGCWHRVAML